ncbi:MAG: PEP-utilizing enzyme [Dehalococcoidia bacterium]|nr:PEP-utilizing enzyme [Dehalococcoidia bacterium]
MAQETKFMLPDPSYEAYTWILQDEHSPASHPPLIASATPVAWTGSSPDGLPTTLNINGYNYAREVVSPAGGANLSGTTEPPKQVEDLTRWRLEWLPQVDELIVMLESFDAATVPAGKWAEVLDGQDQEYRRVFGGIHRTAVGTARMAATRFTEEYVKRFDEDRRGDAMSLLLGLPNRSLDRANALWDLSRTLRADKSLLDTLQGGEPRLDMSAAKRFDEDLKAMLRDFGATTNNGLQDMPTWREGSTVPLSMLGAFAWPEDSTSPREATLRQKNRRLELEEEVRNASGNDEDENSLVRLMEMAQHLIPNLEDHNLLCDQRCVAASRVRWLTVGTHLQNQGILSVADEIFFYRRPELVQVLEGGAGLSKEEVDLRRARQRQLRAMLPPLYLGLPPETLTSIDDVPVEGTVQRLVRGVAASPGSHRGRARVVKSMDEADSLQDGDVLVVRSLTPAWTPYFGVVGALVTNSGGVMSHGAVVAREFGIAAVVGTRDGTNFIMDGAVVTVDGTAGVVVC